jgi:hypothetical protein
MGSCHLARIEPVMKLRRDSLIVGLAITITAAPGMACGHRGADEAVRSAFAELRTAYLTQNYRALCKLMSPTAKREVGELGHEQPTNCPDDVARNLSAAVLAPRDRVTPRIESVEVHGDRATIVARLGGTTPGYVYFSRRGGQWMLRQLFGTSAPPPKVLQ